MAQWSSLSKEFIEKIQKFIKNGQGRLKKSHVIALGAAQVRSQKSPQDLTYVANIVTQIYDDVCEQMHDPVDGP